MSDINITVNDEIVNIDIVDEPVLVNVVNSPGVPGAPGQGVPVGGTTGQVLAKNSDTNYDTEWVDVSGGAWGTITGTLSNQTDLQNALNAKVPYTGATQDVSLGEYGINVGNVIYDTTPTGIPTDQGATYWDDQSETVALVMNGTIQKIGEDTFYPVKNSTGSTIAKGVAVRFAGTDGASGKILIAPFLANGTYPSQYYMGITAEAITNGSNGKVYHFGKIRGVNTSAFADGDILYCSTSVAGGFQTAAPSAPNNIVIAAAVINAANNGTLMVRSTTGSNINTDEGVLLSTPTSGQVLKYNGSLWVNDSVSGALGYTPANSATTLTINGVTYDLSTSRTWTISAGISGSGASGQVAYWTGTSAQSGSNNLFWDNANGRLGVGTNAPISPLQLNADMPTVNGLTITRTGVALADANFQISNLTSLAGQFCPSYFFTSNYLVSSATIGGFIGARITNNSSSDIGLILEARTKSGTALSSGYIVSFRSFTTDYVRIAHNGNMLLQNGGTFTDSGQRLQVQGTTLLNGNVTFSSATGMFWDATNSRLGIGTNAPLYNLDVTGGVRIGSSANGFIFNSNTISTFGNIFLSIQSDRVFSITDSTFNNVYFRVVRNTGNTLLGSTTDSGERLQVTGTAKITSKLSMGAGTTSAAQINLASSTAPTSPANGDIWFDGTDIKMRIGGVTKTFTLV
jgi:hypothetical protein